ncbi:hypothetical protein [Microvirus mar28]|uniref:Uncharacterized protein n=1 Tax=Microvirus mar28 TaxID=2851161 RepID=A0A8F5MLN3_9VIRU|nr:hypothetical protein [Microvirus mar28]
MCQNFSDYHLLIIKIMKFLIFITIMKLLLMFLTICSYCMQNFLLMIFSLRQFFDFVVQSVVFYSGGSGGPPPGALMMLPLSECCACTTWRPPPSGGGYVCAPYIYTGFFLFCVYCI